MKDYKNMFQFTDLNMLSPPDKSVQCGYWVYCISHILCKFKWLPIYLNISIYYLNGMSNLHRCLFKGHNTLQMEVKLKLRLFFPLNNSFKLWIFSWIPGYLPWSGGYRLSRLPGYPETNTVRIKKLWNLCRLCFFF